MSHLLTRKGFTLIEVLIAVLIIGVLATALFFFVPKKSDSQTTSENNPTTKISDTPEADIALQNLGIEKISDNVITTQATREFNSRGLKGMYVFGDTLGKNDPRKNPNFEFASIKPGTKIIAAIDGVIGFIREQADTNDFEVFLQPKDGSAWTIGYDHLTNIQVTKGQHVTAGAILGEAAVENNGQLRFEIQVNKDDASGTKHICPSTLLAANKKESILADLSAAQTAWETTTKLELYDMTKQSPIGCIGTELTPEQAEGR